MGLVRLLAAVPLLVYGVLTPLGVLFDLMHVNRWALAWHPDLLLPFEAVGPVFCASIVLWPGKKEEGPLTGRSQ